MRGLHLTGFASCDTITTSSLHIQVVKILKRILCLLLAAVILLSVTACSDPDEALPLKTETFPNATEYLDGSGYTVPQPMKYPDYTIPDDPSTSRLRATAVKAMRDLLSIRWSTATGISYYKTGPVSDKHFQHQPDTTYAGTLYSNASTGLFQFLEFYDQVTGRLQYPGNSDELKEALGTSCADALIWSWTSVCNSISGAYYPSTMVYQNGYYPVGGYTYDYSIASFYMLPTYTIIVQNGKDVIMEAYTQVQAADALVSTSDNHAMMATATANVVYAEDGSIDSSKSYVTIQDQRGGQGAGFYESKEYGEIIHYSGRTNATYTFDELYEKHYIPVAPAEFLGLKEYEQAEVTAVGGPCETVADLLNMQVQSNYPLAVVNVIAADQHGNEAVIGRKLFGGAEESGVPKTYALSEMECLKTFSDSLYNSESYIIKIEVVTSTGQRFIPIELDI